VIEKITVWVYEQDKIVSLPQSELDEPVRLPAQASGSIPLHRVSVLSREGKRNTVSLTAVFQDEHFRSWARKLPSPGEGFPDFCPSLQSFKAPKSTRVTCGRSSSAVLRRIVQYGFFSSETLSLIRPLARRRFNTSLPPRVFIRARNPNFRFRLTLLG
jgi:hypothetical protein